MYSPGVGSRTTWVGVFLLWLSAVLAQAQSDNDAFAHREPLSGTNATALVYLLDATREEGEPTDPFGTATVWYSWTAPADGFFRVGLSPKPPGFTPGQAVFVGDRLTTLVPQSPVAASAPATATYRARGGETYSLVVYGWDPSNASAALLSDLVLEFAADAANHRFEDRVALSGSFLTVTNWASPLPDAPQEPKVDPNGLLPTMWWNWTAPATGRARVRILSVNTFAYAGAFAGNTLDALTRLDGDALFGDRTWEATAGTPYSIGVATYDIGPVVFQVLLERPLRAVPTPDRPLVAGETLRLDLTGFIEGETVASMLVNVSPLTQLLLPAGPVVQLTNLPAGDFTVTASAIGASGNEYYLAPWQLVVKHPNPTYETRATVSGEAVDLFVDSRNALGDPGEFGELGSVWWSWSPPISGLVLTEFADPAGPFDDRFLPLFRGTSRETLVEVSDRRVVAGETYTLRVDPLFAPQRHYRLRVIPIPPANDDFANARVLGTESFHEFVYTDAARAEPTEPSGAVGATAGSVWYRFTPPADGAVELGVTNANGDWLSGAYPVSAYRGDSLNALVPVLPGGDCCAFPVQSGQPYAFQLQHAFPGQLPIADVSFRFAPAPTNDVFGSAQILTGEHATVEVTFDGAGAEPAEPPAYQGLPAGRTVWFRWTATQPGWVAWRLANEDAPWTDQVPYLQVFAGDALDSLRPVPLIPLHREVRFWAVTPGTTYHLRASTVPVMTRPALLARYPLRLDFSTLEITAPLPSADFVLPELPTFQAGGVRIDLPGTRVEYRLLKSTGPWPPYVESTDSDSLGFGNGSDFRLTPSAWEPQVATVFAVLRKDADAFGYSAPIQVPVRPANDAFERRIPMEGREPRVLTTTRGATFQAGEAIHGDPRMEQTVWYSWKAEADGPVLAFLFSSGSGTQWLQVYRGDSVSSLEAVGSGAAQRVSFEARRGEEFALQVSRNPGDNPVLEAYPLSLELTQSTLSITPLPTNSVIEGDPVLIQVRTTELPESIREVRVLEQNRVWYAGSTLPLDFTWTAGPVGAHVLRLVTTLRSGESLTNTLGRVVVTPRNLSRENAQPIEAERGVLLVPFLSANATPTGTGPVWYRWTAPADGVLYLETPGRVPGNNARLTLTSGETTNAPVGSLPLRGWQAHSVNVGVTYHLAFTGPRFLPDALFEFPFEFHRMPNDDFAQATALTGTDLAVEAVTLAATHEEGEPAHLGTPANRSVWWSWGAPRNGLLVPTRTRSYALYDGTALTNLDRVNLLSGNSASARPSGFPVESGNRYALAFDGGTDLLPLDTNRFRFQPWPLNDDFVARPNLTGRKVRFLADFVLASAEPGEPASTTGNHGHSLWWNWTAPAAGPVTIRATAADNPTRISVNTGETLDELRVVAEGTHSLRFTASAGQKVVLTLDRPEDAPDVAEFEILSEAPLANDRFEDRQRVTGESFAIYGWNETARRDLLEPWHAGVHGGRSVWYSWTASRSGAVSLRLATGPARAMLGVYRGPILASLEPIAQAVRSEADLTADVVVSFAARVGESYSFVVDGAEGDTGDFTLSLQTTPSPEPPTLVISALSVAAVRLQLGSLAGRAVTLETSDDLLRWSPLRSVEAGSDTQDIEEAVEGAAQFYRIAIPSP